MQGLSPDSTDEEGEPSPTSNHQKTALVNTAESEGLPIVNIRESEGLPGAENESEGLPVALVNGKDVRVRVSVNRITGSGIELAPMDNLVTLVNENLRNCTLCNKSRLELEKDCRVGFAVNWKILCKSCAAGESS